MTGEEFEMQIKAIGLKKSDVARKLGIDPDTVTARCRDHDVPAIYAYALIGLSMEQLADPIRKLSRFIDATL